MVRRPCCDKIGLNKGAWSPEEDQILVSYIQRNGHGNWRALPKQAGLLRCGKSCRLRWTNYLRPDIKRGNFSKQEEETIINLHQMLGNRWSAIAARLPGRTDNEIKNVWHTHLKKQLKNYESSQDSKKQSIISISKRDIEKIDVTIPSQCSSEKSTHSSMVVKDEEIDCSSKYFPCVGENFLSQNLSINDDKCLISIREEEEAKKIHMGSRFDDSMDVWYHLFITEEDMRMPHLPEF